MSQDSSVEEGRLAERGVRRTLRRIGRRAASARAPLAVGRDRLPGADLGRRIAPCDSSPAPVSVIAFGSFARGEADADSDIDLAVVRADDVDDADERWADAIDVWRRQVQALTGNDVEIVEATVSEAARKLRGRSELWRNIERDGVVVHGQSLDALTERVGA